VLSPLTGAWRRRSERSAILNNPSFDYGARSSIRQTSASTKYREYFQKLDQEMHFKTIERRILDAITDFLDEHNVSTADIKERQVAILNSGVIVSGGTVTAKNLTVGDKARSIVMHVASAGTSSGSKN
jgi:hypothetical protein